MMGTSQGAGTPICAASSTRRLPSFLTRSSAESALRTWGLRLREKTGFKRAAVAVARKLAVIMHAMLQSGQLFDRTSGALATNQ